MAGHTATKGWVIVRKRNKMFDDYPPQAQLPELYMWRHRLRVMEQILMEHHPEREHLKRLFQSEMVAAAEDAKALMRTRELTGAGALLDISWPPRNQIHLTVGRPSRIIPGMELTEESDTSDEDMPRGESRKIGCRCWWEDADNGPARERYGGAQTVPELGNVGVRRADTINDFPCSQVVPRPTVPMTEEKEEGMMTPIMEGGRTEDRSQQESSGTEEEKTKR